MRDIIKENNLGVEATSAVAFISYISDYTSWSILPVLSQFEMNSHVCMTCSTEGHIKAAFQKVHKVSNFKNKDCNKQWNACPLLIHTQMLQTEKYLCVSLLIKYYQMSIGKIHYLKSADVKALERVSIILGKCFPHSIFLLALLALPPPKTLQMLEQ